MTLSAKKRNLTTLFLLQVTFLTLVACDPATTTGEGLLPSEISTTLHPPGVPPEFETPTNILNYGVDVSAFGGTVSGHAHMTYFGSHAEQELTLTYRPVDGMTVDSHTYTSASAELLPWVRDLDTWGTLFTPEDCDIVGTGYGYHKSWHQYAGNQWGMKTGQSQDIAEDLCDQGPSNPPGGGGGGSSEGDCWECQQWFWYEDGVIVDEWWECHRTDPSYCEMET